MQDDHGQDHGHDTLVEQQHQIAHNMAEVFDVSGQIWQRFLAAQLQEGAPRHADPLNTWPVFAELTRTMWDNPKQVADKTNWRQLLKGEPEPLDLKGLRDTLMEGAREGIGALHSRYGLQAFQPLDDAQELQIRYPVLEYVEKPKSANLDKEPVLEGALLGIKGQYLLLDTAVINIRKYTAYNMAFSVH